MKEATSLLDPTHIYLMNAMPSAGSEQCESSLVEDPNKVMASTDITGLKRLREDDEADVSPVLTKRSSKDDGTGNGSNLEIKPEPDSVDQLKLDQDQTTITNSPLVHQRPGGVPAQSGGESAASGSRPPGPPIGNPLFNAANPSAYRMPVVPGIGPYSALLQQQFPMNPLPVQMQWANPFQMQMQPMQMPMKQQLQSNVKPVKQNPTSLETAQSESAPNQQSSEQDRSNQSPGETQSVRQEHAQQQLTTQSDQTASTPQESQEASEGQQEYHQLPTDQQTAATENAKAGEIENDANAKESQQTRPQDTPQQKGQQVQEMSQQQPQQIPQQGFIPNTIPPNAMQFPQLFSSGGQTHPPAGMSEADAATFARNRMLLAQFPPLAGGLMPPFLAGQMSRQRFDTPPFMGQPMSRSNGISLALSCDDEQLSEYQILVRKQLEIFEAQQEDVESNTQGRKKQVVLGQVGIRCRHCAGFPLRQRGRGAVYYPAKLQGVYQAAQNMASSHLCESCQCIPPNLKQELRALRERRDTASGGKQYWADGARAMGLHESEEGLRLRQRGSAS